MLELCYNHTKGEYAMFNPDEQIVNTRKFLKKLLNILNNEASFTFANMKIVSKTRIDDIICCIEGSFADEYKSYGKKRNVKKLNSQIMYAHLLEILKRKFPLSASQYLIDFKEAAQIITTLMTAYERDLRAIYKEDSGMS